MPVNLLNTSMGRFVSDRFGSVRLDFEVPIVIRGACVFTRSRFIFGGQSTRYRGKHVRERDGESGTFSFLSSSRSSRCHGVFAFALLPCRRLFRLLRFRRLLDYRTVFERLLRTRKWDLCETLFQFRPYSFFLLLFSLLRALPRLSLEIGCSWCLLTDETRILYLQGMLCDSVDFDGI